MIPVIRLTVEHMRQEMSAALMSYTAQLDEDLQQAITDFCKPENLRRIVQQETDRTLDGVIREEVRAWFTRGDGREVIKQAVAKRLADGETWTPLDEEWQR